MTRQKAWVIVTKILKNEHVRLQWDAFKKLSNLSRIKPRVSKQQYETTMEQHFCLQFWYCLVAHSIATNFIHGIRILGDGKVDPKSDGEKRSSLDTSAQLLQSKELRTEEEVHDHALGLISRSMSRQEAEDEKSPLYLTEDQVISRLLGGCDKCDEVL
jgi:hypothetical protein